MFWLNGWVFLYELSGCGFESSCSNEKYYGVENPLLPILKMFGTVVQQSLAQFFNSHWHDSSTVTGIILQQSLARLFNSHWHDSSTLAGTILQQSRLVLLIFSMLAEFFKSDVHCWRIVPCTRNATHDLANVQKRRRF